MFSIFKKDFLAYFNSWVGYVVIGLFLLVTSLFLWVFPETNVLDYGFATMESFFSMSPFILLFLIPAITMRSIAGERGEGTYEWLITKPVSQKQLLRAKYLSCVAIIVLALLPTCIYYVSLYLLGAPRGNIDTGAVIGSYIGILLLGASFAAIGLFISAVSHNAILAFLLSAFLCFVFFIGIDYVVVLLDGRASDMAQYLSMNTHYASMGRGVMDLRDVCYFVSCIAFFLALAHGVLEVGRGGYLYYVRYFGVLMIILGVANGLASIFFFRIDFTNEKRYTISDQTKAILGALPDNVQITVYLDGDLPPGFERLREATRDLLADMKAYAGGQLKYTFVNPLQGDEEERQEAIQMLAQRGIEPTNLSVKTTDGLTQKMIYPCAVLQFGEEEFPLQLLQNNRFVSPDVVLNNSVQNLEYAFVNGIKKLIEGGKPIVAFTEGHDELDNMQLYDAIHSLGVGYQVGRLNLDSVSFETLRQIRVIVIAQPNEAFSELQKFKLDYFIQHGGKMIWAINQVAAALDSMRQSGEQMAVAKSIGLDDMLFKYGVRLNYNLLADLNCAQIPMQVGEVGGASQLTLVPWMFYPIFVPRSTHPIIKNIDGIQGQFVGTLDTLGTPDIHKEVILYSSPFSRVLSVPTLITLDMASEKPDPAVYKGGEHMVGVVLDGTFPSVFRNRPVPEGLVDTFAYRQQTPDQRNRMIVLADGNLLKNEWNQDDQAPYPLGWDRATHQQYGNKTLLLNMVDYLCDDRRLISLREKELQLRLLDKGLVHSNKWFWQTLNVGLPPLLLLLFGFVQAQLRKHRYGIRRSNNNLSKYSNE